MSAPDRSDGLKPVGICGATAAMVDVACFAGLLGVSTRHVRRLADAGRCPAPVRLGSCVRWPRAAVEAWIDAGCPNCRKRSGGAR